MAGDRKQNWKTNKLRKLLMKQQISVIGDGGWGTALALLLHQNQHCVTLWSPFEDYAKQLRETRENKKFLPGYVLADDIQITSSLKEAVENSELIIFAVPTLYARKVLALLKPFDLSKKILVSVSKGVENDTLKRVSEIIEEILGKVNRVVLSGPTHAEEVAKGIPSSIVAGCEDLSMAEKVQKAFMNDHFRVYTNSDVIGVELGGSLKNVIAIAAGISDGLGFGDNTKAALITRGLAEMARLGQTMGAHRETFSGLSGMGDLITTCMSSHSRNRQTGIALSSGKSLDEVTASMEMVAEGVKTTKSAFMLAKKYKVEMPIVEGIHSVLYENKDAKEVFKELMTRQAKVENLEWN